MQGVIFALYGWNATPIDRTDVSQAFVAIGWEFPFPIDMALETLPNKALREGQTALDHCDAVSPFLYKQRNLLGILNNERCLRHQELKNEGITWRKFNVGDLVVVCKQVKSRAEAGVVAKIMFKTKGPYQVVTWDGPGSYKLQQLPFCQGLGRPGWFIKESVARMEKLPSTLVVHKKVDGADTRLATMRGPFLCSPLEWWLRVLHQGTYQQA